MKINSKIKNLGVEEDQKEKQKRFLIKKISMNIKTKKKICSAENFLKEKCVVVLYLAENQ